MSDVRSIATTSHGRYLVDLAGASGTTPLLVGFHGYAESASIQMGRLRHLASEAGGCATVSIQGLHRFYRNQGQDLAASWMTREDRELMIADNLAYVDAVLAAVMAEAGHPSRVVYCGFSQGASMAYRAAALGVTSGDVIALGGDVPPDLPPAALARVPRTLIGRGAADRFYTAAMKDSDVARLRSAGVAVDAAELDAGHAWTDAFTAAAAAWLRRLA